MQFGETTAPWTNRKRAKGEERVSRVCRELVWILFGANRKRINSAQEAWKGRSEADRREADSNLENLLRIIYRNSGRGIYMSQHIAEHIPGPEIHVGIHIGTYIGREIFSWKIFWNICQGVIRYPNICRNKLVLSVCFFCARVIKNAITVVKLFKNCCTFLITGLTYSVARKAFYSKRRVWFSLASH